MIPVPFCFSQENASVLGEMPREVVLTHPIDTVIVKDISDCGVQSETTKA